MRAVSRRFSTDTVDFFLRVCVCEGERDIMYVLVGEERFSFFFVFSQELFCRYLVYNNSSIPFVFFVGRERERDKEREVRVAVSKFPDFQDF